MTRILLVRHGLSEGNAAGIIQGRTDFGLTELGHRQARLTAERLAGEAPVRVFSSPLKRAWQTAEPIAAALGLTIDADPDLQEFDVGAVSGLTGPQARERFPDLAKLWPHALPGAESRDVFHQRIRASLDRMVAMDATVVAVAHGGVVSGICYALLGLDTSRRGVFETANCAVTEITKDRGGRLILTRMNDTCHLAQLVTVVDRG
ncbi:MAG: histidine phosphatase family protein [Dehalococcoidia bacterium]